MFGMSDLFANTTRPNADIYKPRGDRNDPRMGEIISHDEKDYQAADVVIIGCPQDEGVRRNKGRVGAAAAPDAIREQFYKLSTFNIRRRILDAGNVITDGSLEETHDRHCAAVKQCLADGKLVITLGGGNDISYPDGKAMSEVFGVPEWIAINIDAHLDVRADQPRNSGTPYRQLLDKGLLLPGSFYEVGFQSHFLSPVYYDYIRDLGVNRISLELLRSQDHVEQEIKNRIREKFINHSRSLNTFFGFDLDAVRSSDAPGTSAPSPLGLRAGEFIELVNYAAGLANTHLIEFSEVNPTYDQDNRTTRLVAIAMHRICSVRV
jgi:formiminoglutamase